jgi:hypothetical protein
MINTRPAEIYKKDMLEALRLSFPGLLERDLVEAIDYSIMKRGGDSPAVLDNNYKKIKENTTLWQVTDYIVSREPIITVSGVMFKKHGDGPNPFVMLIQEFLR